MTGLPPTIKSLSFMSSSFILNLSLLVPVFLVKSSPDQVQIKTLYYDPRALLVISFLPVDPQVCRVGLKLEVFYGR